MKYVINLICMVLFFWPALYIGYIIQAVWLGFQGGQNLFTDHADACAEKFRRN